MKYLIENFIESNDQQINELKQQLESYKQQLSSMNQTKIPIVSNQRFAPLLSPNETVNNTQLLNKNGAGNEKEEKIF